MGGQEDVNSEADLMKLAFTHCQLKSISKEDIENWSNLLEEKKKTTQSNISVEEVINIFRFLNENNFYFKIYQMKNQTFMEKIPYYEQQPTSVMAGSVLINDGKVSLLNTTDDIKNGILHFVEDELSTNDSKNANKPMKKLNLPNYLRSFARRNVKQFLESALQALAMIDGRQYICRNGLIKIIDYQSTGVVQQNMKYGNGLHQFLELKHRLVPSPLTMVTNFMSNVFYFKKYGKNILGMSGTLGSDADKEFMTEHFNIKFSDIPTHKPKKLHVHPGTVSSNQTDWLDEIGTITKKMKVTDRAVLIICEDMKKMEEIKHHLKEESIDQKPIIYADSENNRQMLETEKMLSKGQVVIATNLAGRGCDFSIDQEIIKNGGLHVLVTFLPANSRVELQAFGRAGRKGQPGSAQIIACHEMLPHYLKLYYNLEEVKKLRDFYYEKSVALVNTEEIPNILRKEKLFARYCSLIKPLMPSGDRPRTRQTDILINSLHEKWAFWLQEHADNQEISQTDLEEHFKETLRLAKDGDTSKSPLDNFYHIQLYGAHKIRENMENVSSSYGGDTCNKLTNNQKDNLNFAIAQFNKSIEMQKQYSSISHYNLAFCILQKDGKANIKEVKYHLEEARENLSCYRNEIVFTLQQIQNSYHSKQSGEDSEESPTNFLNYIQNRVQVVDFWDNKMVEAKQKIEEFLKENTDIVAKGHDIYTILPQGFAEDLPKDHMIYNMLYEYWQMGLLLVYTVEKKPQFSWQAFSVVLIGVVCVVAGAACTMAGFVNVGTGLIAEGVSDIFEGFIGLWSGEFSFKDWSKAKALSFGISLAAGAIGKWYKTGKFWKSGGKACKEKLLQPMKDLFQGTKQCFKTVTNNVVNESGKHVLTKAVKDQCGNVGRIIGQEFLKTGVDKLLEYGKDKILNELEESHQKSLESDCVKHVQNLLTPSHTIIHYIQTVDSGVKKVIDYALEVTENYRNNLEMMSKISGYAKQFVEKFVNEVNLGKEQQKQFKNAKQAFEVIHCGISALDSRLTPFANDFMKDLSKKVTCSNYEKDETEKIKELSDEEFQKCIQVLSKTIGRILSELISNKVKSQVTSVVANKMTTCANKATGKLLDKHFKREKTMNNIKMNADAFQIRHDDNSACGKNDKKLTKSQPDEVKEHAESILDEQKRGGDLDLKVLANVEKQNIIVYQRGKNGELEPLKTITSKSSKGAEEPVKMVYTPPSKKNSDGHYEAIGKDGQILSGTGSGKNCAFAAYHQATNQKNMSSDEMNKATKDLRTKVSDEIKRNPKEYADAISKFNYHIRSGLKGEACMGVGGFRPKFDPEVVKKFKKGAFGDENFDVKGKHDICHVLSYKDIDQLVDQCKSEDKKKGISPGDPDSKSSELIEIISEIDKEATLSNNYDKHADNLRRNNDITHKGNYLKKIFFSHITIFICVYVLVHFTFQNF